VLVDIGIVGEVGRLLVDVAVGVVMWVLLVEVGGGGGGGAGAEEVVACLAQPIVLSHGISAPKDR